MEKRPSVKKRRRSTDSGGLEIHPPVGPLLVSKMNIRKTILLFKGFPHFERAAAVVQA